MLRLASTTEEDEVEAAQTQEEIPPSRVAGIAAAVTRWMPTRIGADCSSCILVVHFRCIEL